MALVEPGATSALVFESLRAAQRKEQPLRLSMSSGRSIVLPSDPVEDVTVRELALENTLLASAVRGL